MRRTPKMSGATIRRNLSFDPDHTTWANIEQAFGGHLLEGDRDTLCTAADRYLVLAESEIVAPDVETARQIVRRIELGRSRLAGALAWPPSATVEFDARNQIESIFATEFRAIARKYEDEAHYKAMGGIEDLLRVGNTLIILGEAIDRVSRKLAEAQTAPSDHGLGWKVFVRDLRDFFNDHGKKATVRKDVDKTAADLTSPFVLFVEAIRDALPAHRPNLASRHALSKSVSAALKRD